MIYDNIFQRIQALNRDLQANNGIVSIGNKVEVSQADADFYHVFFDKLITDVNLNDKVKKLFFSEHYARAVEEAYKFFDNLVQKLSGSETVSGSALMKKVLSASKPVLKINSYTSASEQNEQLGYMEICAGAMTGIRNPRAHDSSWEDTEEQAFQLLVLANHLVCKVKNSVTVDD